MPVGALRNEVGQELDVALLLLGTLLGGGNMEVTWQSCDSDMAVT